MTYDDDPPPRGTYYVGKMDQATWSATTAARRPPAGKSRLTPFRRKLVLRNLVIAAAHRQGIPMNWVARAFGIPRSVVQDAVRSIGERSGRRDAT